MPSADGPKAAKKASRRASFAFENAEVAAGSVEQHELRVARLPTGVWATMPAAVVHGRSEGPTIWLSGAVHGDELNGIAIVRRLLRRLRPKTLRGTVIGVPIVNVFGVPTASRYLPDRRDLNRSFPGSERGSLAARLAHRFFDSVVVRCDLGIDFHAGSGGRANLPQVRCRMSHPEESRLARAFCAPAAVDSTSRPGSLRAAAHHRDIPVLLYEAGEALRLDAHAIDIGVEGTLRVMQALNMIDDAPAPDPAGTVIASRSAWMRASRSGFAVVQVEPGARVEAGDVVATVFDAVGKSEQSVRARFGGLAIGVLRTGLVHRGDALVHIAEVTP